MAPAWTRRRRAAGEVPLIARSGARRVAYIIFVVGLAVGSLCYLALSLRGGWWQVRGLSLGEHPWLLVAAIALNAAGLSAGCWTWWKVLVRPGDAPPFPTLWRIWAISNPARYLPGRVWHVAALGVLAPSAGIPRATLITSLIVHMWFVVLANLILALGALPSTNGALWIALTAGVALSIAAGTSPALLNFVLRLFSRATRKPVLEWTRSWAFGGLLVLLNLLTLIVTGTSACLALHGTVGLPVSEFPKMIATQAAAFLVGYASLVPAGLGVREAALTLLLAPAFSPGWAATVAIILRVWNTVTELLLLAGAMLLTSQVRQWNTSHPS